MWIGSVRARLTASALLLAFSAAAAPPPLAANCSVTSTGMVPLIDLGTGLYKGYMGGLYPGGTNLRPAAHSAAANRLERLVMVDPNGVPDEFGHAVLLSIGMSNATQEFSRFVQIEQSDPNRNHQIVIVDGAQSGWTASRIADPNQNAPYWSTVASRLALNGVTSLQVEAIWLKDAEGDPVDPFPLHAQVLKANMEAILVLLRVRFPNVKQVWLSSRIYAGYASTTLNPEPYAYESGFAFRWIVEDQLAGLSGMNYDPARGIVRVPWVAWGPYLWADGLVPRSDGLVWECTDLQSDGTHPSASGQDKVAQRIRAFLYADPLARRWFADCSPSDDGAFSVPPDVLQLELSGVPGGFSLRWQDLGPISGRATTYELITGSLGALRQSRGFGGAACTQTAIFEHPIADPLPTPAPGQGAYYLLRARNSCGAGIYGEDEAPRAALDAASPCP